MIGTFRYIQRPCTKRPQADRCPMQEGKVIEARLDGRDQYRVSQLPEGEHPGAGQWFAACGVCLSHKSVERLG
jgi:hypothetical protein